MTQKSIFDFRDYKSYLAWRTGPRERRMGEKAAMARALHVQPTYVTQVVHGAAHLSLEQAECLSAHFGFSEEESHYLMLLVLRGRAGTNSLRNYFDRQIDGVLQNRLVLTNRLGAPNRLSEEDRSVYYSSWCYAAVHMALTIPALRTRVAIAQNLQLTVKKVSEILEFLERAGIAKRNGDIYEPEATEVRLGNSSHNILKHHSNWRTQAALSLDREDISDLHYSGVYSLSRADALRIKDKILEELKGTLQCVRDSKEEVLYAYTIDFFRVAPKASR
ncbi:MAG: TIGR02147 family protein [Bdellovibrionales bacterium]|nr:TIGR02147 family protein [Bdellovibrionales bacterium]